MTVTPTGIDHHQQACDALERSTPILLAALRGADGTVRPKKMRWTNGDIAAHIFSTYTEGAKAIRREPSMVGDVPPSAALDEQMIAEVGERDPKALADMLAERIPEFLEVARADASSDVIAFERASSTTLVGLLALDQHLHGGQFAETAGTAWTGRVADMHSPLRAVIPYAFDPAAARGFSGSFTFTLKGVAPVPYAVVDGQMVMDPGGRTDCTITADPQTFLRFGIGVVSQFRATVTGKMRAGGRKPWLGLSVNRLFPPIPHGGVAK